MSVCVVKADAVDVNVTDTEEAAAHNPLVAALTVIVHDPADEVVVIAPVEALTVHLDEVVEYEIVPGPLEVARGDGVNVDEVAGDRFDGAHVIICGARLTVNVTVFVAVL